MMRLMSVLISCIISWQALANSQAINTDTASTLDTKPSVLVQLVEKLPKTKLRKLPPVIAEMAATATPENAQQTRTILQYLLDGELYYIKASKVVVRAVKGEKSKYALTDVMADRTFEPVSKSKISKVKTNNRLRGEIRGYIAKIDLIKNQKKMDVRNQINSKTMEKNL